MIEELKWQSTPKVTLDALFQPKDRLCFLIGSGISLDPPSHLPTGYQFTRVVLEKLIPLEKQEKILRFIDHNRVGKRVRGDFLRFEQLMEYIQDFDPNLQILDCYDRCRDFNFDHQVLAQMLLGGHQVFTTNFDSLIEYALLNYGIPQKKIYPVIHKQNWRMRTLRRYYRVHKLHGSLSDIRCGTDSRESVQATLKQITRTLGGLFQLEKWKERILKDYLRKRNLIILGYSGLDDLDVLPSLWRIRSSKRLLWIVHKEEQALEDILIESLQPNASGQSQSSSSDLDYLSETLFLFAKYNARSPDNIFRITVNTRQLLKWLLNRYTDNSLPTKSPHVAKAFNLSIDLSLSEGEKWFLTGKIFEGCYYLSQSLNAYQNALGFAKEMKNKRLQCMCYFRIGNVLKKQGQSNRANKAYQEALNITEKEKEKDEKFQELMINLQYRIAEGIEAQGHFLEAERRYRQIIDKTNQINDNQLKADVLKRLGFLVDRTGRESGLKYYQQSLRINQKTANVQAIADIKLYFTVHASFNPNWFTRHIWFLQNRRTKNALNHLRQAHDYAEILGHLQVKTRALYLFGNFYANQGKIQKSLEYLLLAKDLAFAIEDVISQFDSLINLGKLYFDQNQFSEALKTEKQALELVNQIDRYESKLLVLRHIAETSLKLRKIDQALEYYQKLCTLIEKQGDLRGKVNELIKISILLYENSYSTETLEILEQALPLAIELDDPELINEIQWRIRYLTSFKIYDHRNIFGL